MVEDKKEVYLKQLEDIERKSKFREARRTYRKHRYKPRPFKPEGKYQEGGEFLKAKEADPIETAAIAYSLMQQGIKSGALRYSLLGAQLYEKIGRGRKAIPRLLKATERSVKLGYSYSGDVYSKIKTFIKINAGEREQGESSLEKKFAVFAAFIIGGLALSLGSLTITGNAVSNLTQTTPGLLGIIFFLAGLVGMFFYFKGK